MAVKNVRPPSPIPPLPSLTWVLARQPLWDHLRRIWEQFSGRPGIFGSDTVPVGTPATGSGGAAGGTTNTLPKWTGGTDVATLGDSTVTDDGTVVTINGTTEVRMAAASLTSGFVTVTGNLPNPTTSAGVALNITGTATSGTPQQVALRARLAAGYTTTGRDYAVQATNESAGTGTDIIAVQRGNVGLYGHCEPAATTGTCVGVMGSVGNSSGSGNTGDINYGVIGSTRTPKDNSINIGVAGFGQQVAGTGRLFIAGYFSTIGTTPASPGFSSVLVLDNVAEAVPIAVFLDNGTAVYSVQDGGQHNFTSDASRAQHTGTKTLTEGAATSIVTVGVPSNSAVGFIVEWTVQANDATDYQSRCGSTYVACVNKAGTLTAVVSDIGTSAFAESAGASTLTVATTAATGTNDVSFQLNATSSLTQTTLSATYFIRKMRGLGSITPL